MCLPDSSKSCDISMPLGDWRVTALRRCDLRRGMPQYPHPKCERSVRTGAPAGTRIDESAHRPRRCVEELRGLIDCPEFGERSNSRVPVPAMSAAPFEAGRCDGLKVRSVMFPPPHRPCSCRARTWGRDAHHRRSEIRIFELTTTCWLRARNRRGEVLCHCRRGAAKTIAAPTANTIATVCDCGKTAFRFNECG